MGPLRVRRAEIADCEVLTSLMLRSAAYDGPYRAMIENYPVSPAMIDAGEVWLGELGSEIAAFYRLNVRGADLDLMFVSDDAQGLGVGRLLFEHMKNFAASEGLGEVTIVAHPPAAGFYRRMGAVDVGVKAAATVGSWDRPILTIGID